MNDQGSAIGMEQQVLSPAPEFEHARPLELPGESPGHGPAQLPLANDDARDFLALQVGLQAAPGGLDFREFRQRMTRLKMAPGGPI